MMDHQPHLSAPGEEIERLKQQRNRAYGFIVVLVVLGVLALMRMNEVRRFSGGSAVVALSGSEPDWTTWPQNPSCHSRYTRYGVAPDIDRLALAYSEHGEGRGPRPTGERVVRWNGRLCVEYSWDATYTECAVLCGVESRVQRREQRDIISDNE